MLRTSGWGVVVTQPIPRPRSRRRPPTPPPPPAPDQYSSYVDFYDQELRWLYQRNLDAGYGWCPQWRMHSEAVQRVTAMHMAWEVAWRDGGSARALWWVNVADPMMRELFNLEGTFKGCSVRQGHRPEHEGGNGPLPQESNQ